MPAPTAFEHLIHMQDRTFCLWQNGEIIANGPLVFTGTSFKIEEVHFDSAMIQRIGGGDITLEII